MIIGHRHDFGNDWAEVIKKWCLGRSLVIPDETAWDALGVLERFWPEYLGGVLSRGARGNSIIVEAIDIGLSLSACQKLKGFEGIVKRLRGGDKDVLPEVRFAAFLVDLGYDPVLDEEHRGKNPDALIVSEGQEIFIDVISPHLSDEITETYAAMRKLAEVLLEKLSQRATNLILDIYCLASPDTVLDAVSSFLDNPLQPSLETVHELSGCALIKCSRKKENPTSFSVDLPADVPPSVLLVSAANLTNNNVFVRYSAADERLKRKMSDKLNQFSPEEINLLVIDIMYVPNGFKVWQPLLRRNLPPARNKRFSGVMLYQRLWNGTGRYGREWYLEQHPDPYKKLPTSFIETLARMEQ